MHRRIKLTAESIAASAGATADVAITRLYPVTVNDPALTESMLSTLRRVAGPDMVSEAAPGHTLGGFFVLRSKGAGPVRLSRIDQEGRGCLDRADESFALLRSG